MTATNTAAASEPILNPQNVQAQTSQLVHVSTVWFNDNWLQILIAVAAGALIVAVLHDAIEDTALTFEDLKEDGYPDKILAWINALTKIPGEKYEDYITRVAQFEIATKVKIADLYDNMNIKRLGREPTLKDRLRLSKYKAAKDFLIGA